jgi:hypothetical protein
MPGQPLGYRSKSRPPTRSSTASPNIVNESRNQDRSRHASRGPSSGLVRQTHRVSGEGPARPGIPAGQRTGNKQIWWPPSGSSRGRQPGVSCPPTRRIYGRRHRSPPTPRTPSWQPSRHGPVAIAVADGSRHRLRHAWFEMCGRLLFRPIAMRIPDRDLGSSFALLAGCTSGTTLASAPQYVPLGPTDRSAQRFRIEFVPAIDRYSATT